MYAAMFFLMIVALMAGISHGSQASSLVQANEVLKEIARGEDVDYNKVIITGNLDLGELNLPSDNSGRRIIVSKIRINNSLIDGDVDFGHSDFTSNIDLSGTTFSGNASFSNSCFNSIVSLENASFLKQADFTLTEFKVWLDLSKAIFSEKAHFDHAEIAGFSDLSFASFKGYADFKDTVFSSYAFLTGVQFDNGVDFYRTEFHRETRFYGARFLGYTNFNDSRFLDYAYFQGSDFQGPVSLNRTKISDLIIDWSAIEGHLVYNEAAYQALMQRFWASGNFDDYNNCYYQYRWQKQLYEPMGFSKAIDIFSWILCGYGVRPLRTLATGFLIIILFGIIYWRVKLAPRLHHDKLADGSVHEESAISAIEEAMYFSAMMFVTRPPYGLHPAGRWRYLIILEYISGWLIMALFLIIMARLMVR